MEGGVHGRPIALHLALGQKQGPRDADDLATRYAGWEFALLLHREWDRYENRAISDRDWSDTHPTAAERIDNLRGALRRYADNDAGERILSFANALSTMFCAMVEKIFDPAFQAALASRDERRVARLTELAVLHGAGRVPDYLGFLPEAADILMEAESWTLLQFVCDATGPLRGEVKAEAENVAVAKLVWRTCEELPEPAYSVLKQVTELPDLGARSRDRTGGPCLVPPSAPSSSP